ncbi:hypothetical protein PM025_13880 [Halorubrum ezzemoulense]|uniref:hypothetical protein n=1 Tax=Halorubrum ezzemoulense TaxID=337243 RepID=UPI00232FC6CE|nr:hypothetical protein [Halorubrum ezzemoulense]MDB2265212.1 hypothetical protein [Halorubrum ezzemoulense]
MGTTDGTDVEIEHLRDRGVQDRIEAVVTSGDVVRGDPTHPVGRPTKRYPRVPVGPSGRRSGDVPSVRERATVVLASGMLWITAGTQLLTAVLEAIPSGAETWIAPPGAVFGALAPPYAPALIAVLLTLPAIRHVDGIAVIDRLREVVAS